MTLRVWKIWDKDCPVCSEMAMFDRSVIYSKGAFYRQLELDEVPNAQKLFDYMKANVVAEDGTIDIPVYLIEWRDLLIGHLQGHQTRAELSQKLSQIAGRKKP
jgi:hypothetical protein